MGFVYVRLVSSNPVSNVFDTFLGFYCMFMSIKGKVLGKVWKSMEACFRFQQTIRRKKVDIGAYVVNEIK